MNNKVQFGPSFHLKSIKKGDVIYASVWRKKGSEKGKLVIASNDQIQYKSDEFAVRVVGDWEELNCSFVARQNFDDVAVYIWNPTEKDVYFDDLTIDCYRGLKKPEHADEKDILRIDIPNSAMDSIEGFRNKALEQDIISSELKSYFDASIQVGGEKIPVSLRLKGDWV
ncbi:MAG: hypothetical protein ACKVH5_06860, partial [Fidelibacterota bacterium]